MKEKEYSEWMSKQGFDLLRHANCCKIAFNGGWESRQTEVDELQKQRDSFIKAYEIEIAKSDELQKNNAWLSGVACRENKRANKLQEEKVSTTTLLGKTIQEKNELQKRVDSILKVVQSMRNEVKHGHMSDEEVQMLSSFADELEQALKGGEDASN